MPDKIATGKLIRVAPDEKYIESQEFARIVAEKNYQRFFVEMTSKEQHVKVFKICHAIADLLEGFNINLYNPIIVSVHKLPDGEQRDALTKLGDCGIDVTLSSFEEYEKRS